MKRVCFACDRKFTARKMSYHRTGGRDYKRCEKMDRYFDKGWTPKARRILNNVNEKSLEPSAWKGGGPGTSYVYLAYNESKKPRFGRTNTKRKGDKRSTENEREKGETIHIPLISNIDDESATAAEAGLIQCFEPKVVTRNRKYEYLTELPAAYESHSDMHEDLLRILKGKLKEWHPFTVEGEDLQEDDEDSIDSADDPDLRIADDLLAEEEEEAGERVRHAEEELSKIRHRRKRLREESAERSEKRRRLELDP